MGIHYLNEYRVMLVFCVTLDENTGLSEILKHGTHEVKSYLDTRLT